MVKFHSHVRRIFSDPVEEALVALRRCERTIARATVRLCSKAMSRTPFDQALLVEDGGHAPRWSALEAKCVRRDL